MRLGEQISVHPVKVKGLEWKATQEAWVPIFRRHQPMLTSLATSVTGDPLTGPSPF